MVAWVALVDDLSGLEVTDDQWLRRDAIPPTLIALLKEVGRVYVPAMLANARALLARADQVETEIDGLPWVQNPFPYQGKCLKWLREEFAALSADNQSVARQLLAEGGCADLIFAPL